MSRRTPLLLLGLALAACSSSADDAPVAADPTQAVTDAPAASDAPAAGASDTTVAPAPSDADQAGADQAGTDSAAEPTAPVVEAPEAIRFSAPLIGGGEIDLAGFAGRPVLLWFWSPF